MICNIQTVRSEDVEKVLELFPPEMLTEADRRFTLEYLAHSREVLSSVAETIPHLES